MADDGTLALDDFETVEVTVTAMVNTAPNAIDDVATVVTTINPVDDGNDDDNLYGDEESDILSSGRGKDIIDGGSGNDSLSGGRGDDQLSGGEGSDELSGGRGEDIIDGGVGMILGPVVGAMLFFPVARVRMSHLKIFPKQKFKNKPMHTTQHN